MVRVRAGAEVRASPRLASMVPRFMAKTSVVPKKKRGPAPTGKGVQVGERWHPSELAKIDAWIASSPDKALTRAHAIRRLVALGLAVKTKAGSLSSDSLPSKPLKRPGRRTRAQDLAKDAIEKMADPAASPEERAHRRRRLTKGPEEFREARVDQPKRKT
jgi:hypothetical protein